MDRDGKLITVMNDDNVMLGSYPVEDDMRIHVRATFSVSYVH